MANGYIVGLEWISTEHEDDEKVLHNYQEAHSELVPWDSEKSILPVYPPCTGWC